MQTTDTLYNYYLMKINCWLANSCLSTFRLYPFAKFIKIACFNKNSRRLFPDITYYKS